jgi:tetratricopeptide (TPR) repeat protein
MRRSVAAGLVTIALGGVGCASSARSASPSSSVSQPGAVPSWLPAYSAEQRALLEPVDTHIQVPAPRVYPDLGRFRYARDVKLDDIRRTLRFSILVADVLEKSPRFYALGDARPELSNIAAQYGPPGPSEPDPWETVKTDKNGERSLVRAALDEPARADYARAEALRAKGDVPGAISALSDTYDRSRTPAIGLALADLRAQRGEEDGALIIYRRLIEDEPTLASAHLGLAGVHMRAGRHEYARREIAEAIAYHPSSRRALAMADKLTGGRATKNAERVPPFSIFLDVDAVGAVHVAWSGGEPARFYAGCRAILRYEPDIRATLFDDPPGTPYYLSMVEEMVCIEAAIGAYVAERMTDKAAPFDDRMESLVRLAHQEGLAGYAMTEILGRFRPERARVAPPDVHQAMVRYVEHVILGQSVSPVEEPPSGMYTAQR